MQIDLPPHEYKSDREKPREPFFGPGAPNALAYVISFGIVFAISYWLRH